MSKKNIVSQATVQSASQVAIGNNIQQIIIQNGDQKGIAGNTNNNNCKHNHNGGGNGYGHHNSNNNSNNAPTIDNNNNQYLVQNAVGDNNYQVLDAEFKSSIIFRKFEPVDLPSEGKNIESYVR